MDAQRSSSPSGGARRHATSGATSPSETPTGRSSALSRRGAAELELELELFAGLLVPVPPDLAEAEPADERERRLGFREIGRHWDEEDGEELEFELKLSGSSP